MTAMTFSCFESVLSLILGDSMYYLLLDKSSDIKAGIKVRAY